MTKLYQKDPLLFALVCIGVYVCTFSTAESSSARLGVPYMLTIPTGAVLCLILDGWIRRQGLAEFLGLCRFRGTAGRYLWFLPLAELASCNLWHGVQVNFPPLETLTYILTMLIAGFLEEVLFRGLLFTALRPRGLKRAVLISALTFGLGHIVNLLNGAALLPTLLQLCYACAIGLLFTVLFQKSGSILPGILTHSLLNALSAFSIEGVAVYQIITAALLTLTALLYTLWLVKKA